MGKTRFTTFIFTIYCLISSTLAGTDNFNKPDVTTEKKKLYWLNWIDYKGKNTVTNFENQYNTKVFYSIFDSNAVLEGKLLSGQSGFDVVVPSQDYFAVLCKMGIFTKLEHNQLPNLKYIDKQIIAKINKNLNFDILDYGIPYLWGTTGIGINQKIIEKVLGKSAPTDSWALVFEEENIKALHKYGVGFIDAPNEILDSLLAYMKIDNPTLADYKKAFDKLEAIRPYISYFNSTRLVNDLANNDICISVAWSGDIQMAKKRSANSTNIEYIIPKEGALMWVDVLAIPKNAKNKKEAHLLLNYLLDPKVIAEVTTDSGFANANSDSLTYIKPSFAANKNIFISNDVMNRLFTSKIVEPKIKKFITRKWSRLKANSCELPPP